MIWQEKLNAALSGLYPVTKKPVTGPDPCYLTYEEVQGRYTAHASNQAQRITHMIQVDIFSRQAVGPELTEVRAALGLAGANVVSWGPEQYEPDTRWHHLPITCYMDERMEEEHA